MQSANSIYTTLHHDVILGCWRYVATNVIGSDGSSCGICHNAFVTKETLDGWNEEAPLHVCECVCWDNWKAWSAKHFEWSWSVVKALTCVLVIVVGVRIYRGENKTCVDVVGCSTGIQGNRNISSKNGIKIVKINLVNVFDFFSLKF